MKKNKEKSDFILIATIGRSKGLKGEFFINSLCNPKENLINYSNFLIGNSKDPIKLEYIKNLNSKLISKISSINDIDSIKELTNKELFIHKSELPKLPEGEIYWHDLIGMKVVNMLKEDLGIIDEVDNYGSSDILKVIPSESSIDNELRLIPYIKDKYINSISIEKNQLNVDWAKDY